MPKKKSGKYFDLIVVKHRNTKERHMNWLADTGWNLYSLPTGNNKHRVRVMVFSVTFNDVAAISGWSVVLVEETGVPGENHRPVARHWQTIIIGYSNNANN